MKSRNAKDSEETSRLLDDQNESIQLSLLTPASPESDKAGNSIVVINVSDSEDDRDSDTGIPENSCCRRSLSWWHHTDLLQRCLLIGVSDVKGISRRNMLSAAMRWTVTTGWPLIFSSLTARDVFDYYMHPELRYDNSLTQIFWERRITHARGPVIWVVSFWMSITMDYGLRDCCRFRLCYQV